MAFEVKSYHVSHGGIPASLNSLDAWQDYVLDLNRELHALRDSWRVYCEQCTPTDADNKLFAAAEDRLEGLKHEAIGRMRAWEAKRSPSSPQGGRRR